MERPTTASITAVKPSLTNLEFFTTYCRYEFEDMRVICRMAESMFVKRGVANRPVWEREAVFDAWLREPFDVTAWDRAHISGINPV